MTILIDFGLNLQHIWNTFSDEFHDPMLKS